MISWPHMTKILELCLLSLGVVELGSRQASASTDLIREGRPYMFGSLSIFLYFSRKGYIRHIYVELALGPRLRPKDSTTLTNLLLY